MTSLADAASQAERATGLPKTTCMTLLDAGWTLVMDMRAPTRWEQPAPDWAAISDGRAGEAS